jgi:replicative DNA helicase
VTLCSELEKGNVLDMCGGREYITSLLTAVPTAFHVEYYARLVADCSVRRRTIAVASNIAQIAWDESNDLSAMVMQSKCLVTDITIKGSTVMDFAADVDTYYKDIVAHYESQEPWGIKTGLPELDRYITLAPGTLNIIAARPSQGKTALALNIMRLVGMRNEGVAICSLEMSKPALILRLLCMETGFDSVTVEKGGNNEEERAAIIAAVQLLRGRKHYIDDRGIQDLETMRDFITTAVVQHDARIAIIDYLGLIDIKSSDKDNRTNEIAKLTRGLRQMGKDLGIPIICLSQLSRDIEKRGLEKGMLPHRLSDLRDSGAIEQDADTVIFVDRPNRYNPAHFEKHLTADGRWVELAVLHIAKNRQRACDDVEMLFEGKTFRFS